MRFYWNTIKQLRANVDATYNDWATVSKALARNQSELSALQDAFRNGVKLSAEQKEKIADLQEENNLILTELEVINDLNTELSAENDDLLRKLELLQSVLGQLNIAVKLPVKKSRG